MSGTLYVGNDIVDLGHPRCLGKSRDLRFLNRVFHSSESSRILSEPDPDRSLWLHWAAKEAAFKVVSKILDSPPVFSHAKFVVSVEQDSDLRSGGFPIWGSVEWNNLELPFRAAVNESRVHALSWSGRDPLEDAPDVEIGTGEAVVRSGDLLGTGAASFEFMLNEKFTERERQSIHSPGSAYGRLLARTAIADALDVEEARLEIVCGPRPDGRTAPRALLDGKDSGLDVSLSHHGDHVAWAYTLKKRPTQEMEGELRSTT